MPIHYHSWQGTEGCEVVVPKHGYLVCGLCLTGTCILRNQEVICQSGVPPLRKNHNLEEEEVMVCEDSWRQWDSKPLKVVLVLMNGGCGNGRDVKMNK